MKITPLCGAAALAFHFSSLRISTNPSLQIRPHEFFVCCDSLSDWAVTKWEYELWLCQQLKPSTWINHITANMVSPLFIPTLRRIIDTTFLYFTFVFQDITVNGETYWGAAVPLSFLTNIFHISHCLIAPSQGNNFGLQMRLLHIQCSALSLTASDIKNHGTKDKNQACWTFWQEFVWCPRWVMISVCDTLK